MGSSRGGQSPGRGFRGHSLAFRFQPETQTQPSRTGAHGGFWLVSSSDTERLLCLGCSGQGRPSLLFGQGPADTRASPLPLRPAASSSSPSLYFLLVQPRRDTRHPALPPAVSAKPGRASLVIGGLGVQLSRLHPPPPTRRQRWGA